MLVLELKIQNDPWMWAFELKTGIYQTNVHVIALSVSSCY